MFVERVNVSATITFTDGGDDDEAPDAGFLHSIDDVAGCVGFESCLDKGQMSSQSVEYGVLPAHSIRDGSSVAGITANDADAFTLVILRAMHEGSYLMAVAKGPLYNGLAGLARGSKNKKFHLL